MSNEAYLMIANIIAIFHGVTVALLISTSIINVFTTKDIPWWYLILIMIIVTIALISYSLGYGCPVTKVEWYFRNLAGETVHSGSFITHYLEVIFDTKFSLSTIRTIEATIGIFLGAIPITFIVRTFKNKPLKNTQEV